MVHTNLCALKSSLHFCLPASLLSRPCCFLTHKLTADQRQSDLPIVLPCIRFWRPSWVVHVWLPLASFSADNPAIQDGSILSAEWNAESLGDCNWSIVGEVTFVPFFEDRGGKGRVPLIWEGAKQDMRRPEWLQGGVQAHASLRTLPSVIN